MIDLTLIGIGTGNPEHMTLQAIRAINTTDLVLIPRKGADKADLAELRRAICDEVLTNPATKVVGFDLPVRDAANPSYHAGVEDWHNAVAAAWAREIRAHLGDTGSVALLVWGDPCLYDSSLRIADRVAADLPLTVGVIPGITSVQALAAAHRITLNTVGGPFIVTTGRRLRDHGWPEGVETVIVMLDGECSFQTLDPEGLDIWWGAYVGMAQEFILSGPLADTAPLIRAKRAEARTAHGWIMDIYMLRRT